MRFLLPTLAGLLLTAATVQAGEPTLARTWKITVYPPNHPPLPAWLLKIEVKDGKLTGTLTTAEEFPPSELKDLVYKNKKLTAVLVINKNPFPLAIQVPKAGEKTLFGAI